MKVEKGKIVKATRAELFGVWLKRGLDDFMEFEEFLTVCRENGTEVVENAND